jgi:hypothetical protein
MPKMPANIRRTSNRVVVRFKNGFKETHQLKSWFRSQNDGRFSFSVPDMIVNVTGKTPLCLNSKTPS